MHHFFFFLPTPTIIPNCNFSFFFLTSTSPSKFLVSYFPDSPHTATRYLHSSLLLAASTDSVIGQIRVKSINTIFFLVQKFNFDCSITCDSHRDMSSSCTGELKLTALCMTDAPWALWTEACWGPMRNPTIGTSLSLAFCFLQKIKSIKPSIIFDFCLTLFLNTLSSSSLLKNPEKIFRFDWTIEAMASLEKSLHELSLDGERALKSNNSTHDG